ncbi:biotin/lipoyl-binding carrier protein [Mesorhizobium sp. IMUNJ 23232]|uniref:biotin/lipoyl-binding carrier protein n=1 Tax=Mesorhizobium sp. IMUNJ 23232 TaxID=3376064 RepID=UPI0037B6FFB3
MVDVTAEIGGNVWKVLVSAGQKVAEGDTLVILECMKMEVPVLAPVSGTVSEVSVAEGGAVDEGGGVVVIAEG